MERGAWGKHGDWNSSSFGLPSRAAQRRTSQGVMDCGLKSRVWHVSGPTPIVRPMSWQLADVPRPRAKSNDKLHSAQQRCCETWFEAQDSSNLARGLESRLRDRPGRSRVDVCRCASRDFGGIQPCVDATSSPLALSLVHRAPLQ